MQNFQLLSEVGRCAKPVLLKRGLSATIEEWLMAAEYIVKEGNREVILCERGIRTFETATRNTFDVSAVPVVQLACHLPVIVDPSHATGRRDLVLPCRLPASRPVPTACWSRCTPTRSSPSVTGRSRCRRWPSPNTPAAAASSSAGPARRSRNGRGVARSARRHDRAHRRRSHGWFPGARRPRAGRSHARRRLQSQPRDDRRRARVRSHNRGGGQPRRGRLRRRPGVRVHAGAADRRARAPGAAWPLPKRS